MSWKVYVTPDAAEELEATERWYEAHSALRAEFVIAIDRAVSDISERPLRYPPEASTRLLGAQVEPNQTFSALFATDAAERKLSRSA